MRLFLVADMEGATGVVHRDELMDEGGERYRTACALLTGDVNAAVEGAVAEGVTEVVVSEGHAHMRNLRVEDLHPAARVVRGPAQWEQKPLCQVKGLDEGFDLAFFVGFHARAGTENGLLAHTWAGAVVHAIRLNGQLVGETAINAAICGDAGVPVALVVGGDDVCREASADLPGVLTVATKEVYGPNLAACWGPKATGPRIREGAALAVRRHREGAFSPFRPGSPATADLVVHRREMADRMVGVPGLERVGERELRAVAERPSDALSTLWRGIAEVFREPAAWLR